MTYQEDDMLMLSGIQHYMFCPRQWALIHVEQQWSDNRLTIEGNILHENVDNPNYRTKNGDTITLRTLHIANKELGLYGIADAIELYPVDDELKSFHHEKYPGNWGMLPIEYKRGHAKTDDCDKVQLAAQAMCLEEMFNISVPRGALFYWETRSREYVDIDNALRAETARYAKKMHETYDSGVTPQGKNNQSCKRCSLVDICCPKLETKSDVTRYLKKNLYEENA